LTTPAGYLLFHWRNKLDLVGFKTGTSFGRGMMIAGNLAPAAFAVKRAYLHAIAMGVEARIAFDVACASYRATHPELRDDKLRSAVAHLLAARAPGDLDLTP
jgi:hypothetical protein